jgi:uncharacterized protein (DUF433 family)
MVLIIKADIGQPDSFSGRPGLEEPSWLSPYDQVADEILRQQLAPKHADIEVVEKITGSQAMIKGTRILLSIIIGYSRLGETPESLVEKILPHLTLAQVYDALSYYHDHRDDIEQELLENTEEHARTYLREHLGEAGYLRVTGQGQMRGEPVKFLLDEHIWGNCSGGSALM